MSQRKHTEPKKKFESSAVTKKTFSYAKGDTNLNFTLRIDIKDELKDFLVCLEKSVEEVKAEIAKK